MKKVHRNTSRAQSVVFCGLVVALITATAWITIPIGVVPVTLQVFVVIFALFVLTPKQYLISLLVYLLIGAAGLPVFSGMRGGLGALMGPTGGFLWGFLIAAVAVFLVRQIYTSMNSHKNSHSHKIFDKISQDQAASLRLAQPRKKTPFSLSVLEAFSFLIVLYLCGWAQLMLVTGLDAGAAFVVGVAPFIFIDIIKAALALIVAQAVMRVLPQEARV